MNMKKALITLGVQAILGVSIVGLLITGVKAKAEEINVNCDFCGEVFNNETTQLKDMCDICFGWNEHKASLTENGIEVNGYHFQGKR